MYRLFTLYSGSTGNSVFLEAADKRILIDAGKNAKALCAALRDIGSDISEIDAIFITHEHSDHISALEVISKRHSIPIHIMTKSAAKIDRYEDSFASRHLVRHDDEYELSLGDLTVRSFKTPHDSLMSVGYRIDFCDSDGAHSIGIATDIGYVTKSIAASLLGCEAVVLESNHDIEMLNEGRYPYDLKKRILSKKGHLSNKESAAFAAYLAQNGTRAFLLAHLSEENNTPEIALDEYNSVIADPEVFICAASPECPTCLYIPKKGGDLECSQ
jgi:phosphoribosyl 1,2-cyclic phosphodiesterase